MKVAKKGRGGVKTKQKKNLPGKKKPQKKAFAKKKAKGAEPVKKTPKLDPVLKKKLEESEDDLSVSEGEDKANVNFLPEEEDSAASEDESGDELAVHKQSLAKLKHTDPEFYKFLAENDKKLLNFNVSDSENEGDESEEEEKIHTLPDQLEVASDESDFDDGGKVDERIVTLKTLKHWKESLVTDKTSKTIVSVMQAFHACLNRVSSEDQQDVCAYRVTGSAVFNGVIQLCVLHLKPALHRYLKIVPKSKQPVAKYKKFVKIRIRVKDYVKDLLKLLGRVTSSNILTVLLKHFHGMCNFVAAYSNLSKKVLSRLIRLWGGGEETVRVLAFLCILRVVNIDSTSLLERSLKAMHLEYIRSSKFVSVQSLANVNFMRRSLIEMFLLDPSVSYKYAFLYIRQLAIHLRNAVTVHKTEHIQAVYNWQYLNSLKLWSNVLAATRDKPQLQGLLYPLVQIAIGTIRLLPTRQYFPLRYHCLQMLIELSRETSVYIPILPLILESITVFDLNGKHKKVSMRPLQLTCLLRFSKSQLIENTTKDAVFEAIHDMLLIYLGDQAYNLSFPDLAFTCILQLKAFIKKCSIINYTKKLKILLDLIVRTSQVIDDEKKRIRFEITDTKKIEAFQSTLRNKGTPLGNFYANWRKIHEAKRQKEITKNEELGEYNLPLLKKQKRKKEPQKGPIELFPDSSGSENEMGIGKLDDDSDKEEVDIKKESKPKEKVVKKRRTKKRKMKQSEEPGEGPPDVVEDIKISDW